MFIMHHLISRKEPHALQFSGMTVKRRAAFERGAKRLAAKEDALLEMSAFQ